MKTAILFTAFIFISGMSGLFAQHNMPINPIPSFNCLLTTQTTGFKEFVSKGNPAREKRDMDVVISSSSTSPVTVFAKVWVCKENGIQVLGPYTLYLDELLSVPIDNGQWGVIIKCDWSVMASVWTE